MLILSIAPIDINCSLILGKCYRFTCNLYLRIHNVREMSVWSSQKVTWRKSVKRLRSTRSELLLVLDWWLRWMWLFHPATLVSIHLRLLSSRLQHITNPFHYHHHRFIFKMFLTSNLNNLCRFLTFRLRLTRELLKSSPLSSSSRRETRSDLLKLHF